MAETKRLLERAALFLCGFLGDRIDRALRFEHGFGPWRRPVAIAAFTFFDRGAPNSVRWAVFVAVNGASRLAWRVWRLGFGICRDVSSLFCWFV